jgi:predicted nucleic acid-binding protein
MARPPDKTYLPDTSALFALMEDESGADRVEAILQSGRVLLSFVVLMEVYYVSLQEQGEEIATQRYALLKNLDAEEINTVTEPVLLRAGRFKATHRVSFADALIASFAVDRGAVLVHKDPEYLALQAEVLQESLL